MRLDDNDQKRSGRAYDPAADSEPYEQPAKAKVKPFDLIAIRDIPEIIELDWLIEDLIPRFSDDGTAGYIFAPAKARKSMLLCDFGLSVTSGTPALGKYKVMHQGAAVGFFAEDPKGETSRRVHRMARHRGIDVPANLRLINEPCIAIDNLEHQERLLSTLTAIPDLMLAWFDPMVRLHRVNDNRAEEIGPIHTFLRTLARACPKTVFVLAHHANKEGGARGSTDYDAFGDFNLYGRKKDRLTTEIHEIQVRGGSPPAPFAFTVKDGSNDAGATLQLVPSSLEEADEDTTMAIEQTIIAYKASNAGIGGREALTNLRRSGVKVGNNFFWEVWKRA